jgi:hypothetical protein
MLRVHIENRNNAANDTSANRAAGIILVKMTERKNLRGKIHNNTPHSKETWSIEERLQVEHSIVVKQAPHETQQQQSAKDLLSC